MKRRSLILTTTALTAALVLGFGTPQVQAQGRGGFRGMQAMGRTMDPTTNAYTALLQRDDVKSEIRLSQRQGEQITAEQTKSQQAMQEKMQANRPDFQAMRDLPAEDRQAKVEEFRTKMQETAQEGMASMATAVDKKAQEVLTPEQIKRLKELDFQWRGGLALADKKTADDFKLTPEQRTKVAGLLAEYKKAQQDTMTAVFAGFRPQPGGGQPTPPDPTEMQTKMTEAQEKVDKMREESGKKVVALLTDEQKTAWTTAQGKKFTFRKHDQ